MGQTHVVGPGTALTKLVSRASFPPRSILWGPAGTGKTTLSHLLAEIRWVPNWMPG